MANPKAYEALRPLIVLVLGMLFMGFVMKAGNLQTIDKKQLPEIAKVKHD